MGKKACKLSLKGSPLFKPKGCTTKKGIHVHDKFVTNKGHVFNSKKKNGDKSKLHASFREPAPKKARGIRPMPGSGLPLLKDSSAERINALISKYELKEKVQKNRAKYKSIFKRS